MKMRNKVNFKSPRIMFMIFLVFLFILFIQYCYLSLAPKVYGIDMQEFASNRNTYSSTIYAKRGSVFDSEGNTLAMDVSSYTIVAYLDESRTGSSPKIYHVKDKESTAKALAPILGCTEEYLVNLFSQELYQTYLGSYGNNISEITKNKIQELNLPGIEFEESYKRYYPNGDFASYILGYAKKQNSILVQKGKTYDLNTILKSIIGESKNITWNVNNADISSVSADGILTAYTPGTTTVTILSGGKSIGICMVTVEVNEVKTKLENRIFGELGIEVKYEDILRGINGYLEYQADKFGYKIPDTPENSKNAENGSDIYLTLDANIQRILEGAVKDTNEKYKPEWITFTIMDAKTGDILGTSSTPSFNPNDLNTITNYEDPLTSFVYEPGSVMKIFTYMCAMEKGTYKGNETFPSGKIVIEDKTVYDWNRVGWGTITYDYGFQMSSNVGVSYIMQNFLNKDDLKTCLSNYGFGKATGIELPREMSGKIVFNYPVEIAAAAYGQGISTTPIQQLQALSMIANNGTMIRPNIIKKIVDSSGKTTYERQIQKTDNVVGPSTVEAIKQLMLNTVNEGTGTGYKVKDLNIIGKTGTAEYYDNALGGYASSNNIYSFAGMYPYENPEIIVFASVKKPNNASSSTLIKMVQPVMESVAKYKGFIKGNSSVSDSKEKFVLENYINKATADIKNSLTDKGLTPIIVGNGEKIINQYPYEGINILSGDKVFLLTNDSNLMMPSLKGYTRIEAISLLNLLNIPYEIEGYGIVEEQSIKEGTKIEDGTIKLILKQQYDFDKKE